MELDEIDGAVDTVSWGVLRSEVSSYPLVAGIPVFVDVDDSVTDLLYAGDLRRALAVAAFGPLPSSRLGRLVEAIAAQGRRPERMLGPARRLLRRRAVDRRQDVVTPGPGFGHRILAEQFLQGPDRSADAFNYFSYRFGIPRHLVGLGFTAALPPFASVIDIGCGAGQLTWGISQRVAAVTGVDRDLRLLLVASEMAPTADLVCAECTTLPFAAAAFDAAFSSDVLSYVRHKPAAVAEAFRVVRADGMLLATSLRNRNCTHVFGGEALSPEGWADLAGERNHRLIPDTAALEAYVAGRTPDLATTGAEGAVKTSQTLSLAIGPRAALDQLSDRPLGEWPHAEGQLAINPLFRPVAEVDGIVTFDRAIPSATFERDNPEMERYLPHRFQLSSDVLARARRDERPPELDGLIRSAAVLALPPSWPGDRWPVPE